MREMLQQEDQMEQTITPVDFEQERIINVQYTEVLNSSARDVVDHKRRVMDATVAMNRKRHALKITQVCNEDLDTSIERVIRMEAQLHKELVHIQDDTERLKLTRADLKMQVEEYRASANASIC